jgi:DNA-binding MarR family transcriptional regulator
MKHAEPTTYRIEDSVGYLIRQGGALMRQELDHQFQHGDLTSVQWLTLMRLRDDPQCSAALLSRWLHHDSGAFTRVLDQLEAKGFLARERSLEDRRSVVLHLTDAGRAAAQAALPRVLDHINDALHDFTADEVTQLKQLLHKLIGRLESRAHRNGSTP